MTATLRLDPWALRLPPRMIEPSPAEQRARRRTRIWELSPHLHCSIVGTCLSTSELRQVLAKAGMAEGGSEHERHGQGVLLAGLRDGRAKLLHKALDRRHRLAIGRFADARTPEDVRGRWREAARQGDIPGGYWAALTQPATDDALIREIFGEVHMLSHLVGAANRADIRRLSELEAENARLREKLARQQEHLRHDITTRDARICELSDLLARRIANQPREDAADAATLTALISDLEHRLRRETNRRAALEGRLVRATENLEQERRHNGALTSRVRALTDELDAIEAGFVSCPDDPEPPPPSLAGLTLLYAGGRPDKLGHLRTLSERLGLRFLHHAGGIDDRSGLLGGLVSRVDLVMFPVDCISHDAATAVKRLCRQMDRPFVPLRGSGTASLAAALQAWSQRPAP